ncbi:MAG: FAD-binding oxidoreductase [Planctomycetes bacterium]|nr:FAD-binding oxidoreductase [Planctomycetota bacterium]
MELWPGDRSMGSTLEIDGFGPLPLVRPGSAAELGEIVRAAASNGSALYPLGGGTKLDLGNPPTRQGNVVDMRALNQVIDFPARDMTVTVQAGMAVASLQEILAHEKLRLPIDVASLRSLTLPARREGAQQSTVGGVLATNESGPRRLGFGTLRDYVIGISVMNDEGREFKAGGRVVKNVAGYDLCKLLVGSLGTLGIITQVTFKLRPLADQHALAAIPCAAESLEELVNRIHGSRTRPVALEALNPSAASVALGQVSLPLPTGHWMVIAGYEGNHTAVEWQVRELAKELGAVTPEVRIGDTAEPLWQALIEFNAWPETKVTFKANLLPSATAAFCAAVDRLAPNTLTKAHAGSGIVVGHLTGDWTRDRTAAFLAVWRELAGKAQGRVIVTRCPWEWKNVINVWGPIGGDAWLMREVKEKFDPHGIFNPGRFYHGI